MDGCMTWSSSLESILEDASALEAFKEWFKDDDTRLTDSIDLYFAIKAFKYINIYTYLFLYLLSFDIQSYGWLNWNLGILVW